MNDSFPNELELLKKKFDHYKQNLGRYIGIAILLMLGLLMLPSLFFQADPDEDAVVLRFGKFIRIEGPGLHLKIPFGIETVTKVKTRAILKEEFGFSTIRAGVRTEYDRSNASYYDKESIMLTGDLNVADVEWIVQYRIKDAKDYLFNVRNVEANVRVLSESVMRHIVGDREVNEVLTYGRSEIEGSAGQALQQIMDEYRSGIDIVTIKLQDVNPPDRVKPSFNEVNEAKQDSDRLVNEALQAYNKVIPEARGKAEQTLSIAQGYAINRINQAKGDAVAFLKLEQEYARAPSVTRKRLYLETMGKIIAKVEKVYVVDPDLKSLVPLIQLNK